MPNGRKIRKRNLWRAVFLYCTSRHFRIFYTREPTNDIKKKKKKKQSVYDLRTCRAIVVPRERNEKNDDNNCGARKMHKKKMRRDCCGRARLCKFEIYRFKYVKREPKWLMRCCFHTFPRKSRSPSPLICVYVVFPVDWLEKYQIRASYNENKKKKINEYVTFPS